jgi:hypothetical protein
MVSHMKTTVEIGDDILHRSRRVLRKEGGTLRALVEEGLILALSRRERSPKIQVKPVTFRGQGLQPEFRGASWHKIRDAIYPHDRR